MTNKQKHEREDPEDFDSSKWERSEGKGRASWNRRLSKFEAYKKRHGHLDIETSSSIYGLARSLYSFYILGSGYNIRNVDGTYSPRSEADLAVFEERRDQLIEMGLFAHLLLTFEEELALVQDALTNDPEGVRDGTARIDGKTLVASWINYQKSKAIKGRLSDAEIDLLIKSDPPVFRQNVIDHLVSGAPLRNSFEAWHQRLEENERILAEDVPGPERDSARYWRSRQRRLFREGRMSPDRAKAFESSSLL